ncbi:MAG: class I SAM-dependent rRNA methyltransferase [Ignavibacteria bacterium]|nr:class I SAM-dependent rRNA methyltransferase [Ignavibacteria bacterium]
MAAIFLKKNESRRIRNGHQWVFSNEIAKTEGSPESGVLAELYDQKEYLGTGFYNKNSLISLRLLNNTYEDDLGSYIKDSILKANDLRKTFYPNRESYRMVFSESDFLPGLIIDKYNNTYVMQVYCFGMNENIQLVVDVLKNDLGAENIFTRNDPYFRKLEGLPEDDTVFLGEATPETIDDGSLKYKIDFASSQKTGFYFDQCDNREFIEKISGGKTVLDAFCNSGGFGMHASKAGAGFVTFLDSSTGEIENAEKNFALNELTSETDFIVMDVFDYFTKSIDAGRTFDIVMVDPPAFAKSRKSIPTALKGYAKLNKMAASCVGVNGYLVTSSCSHHVSQEDFLEAVISGASKANRKLQQVHFNGASFDHPSIPGMNETTYLKFAVFKVF